MLKKISINGFKSILDQKFDLGRVNLFIGANGTGKSNILEAIGMLSGALGRDLSEAELQQKGIRLSVPTQFKSAFKNRDLRVNFGIDGKFDNQVEYDIRVTASQTSDKLRFFTEHIRCGSVAYLGRSNHGVTIRGARGRKEDMSPERGLWDRYGELIEVPEKMREELNTFSQYKIYSPQTAFLRGTELENMPVAPTGLCGGGLPQATSTVFRIYNSLKSSKHRKTNEDVQRKLSLFEDVLDLVWAPGWAKSVRVKGLDPSFVSRAVKTGNSTLYFEDRFLRIDRNELSAYDSSEGSLYLLFLAVLALHPEAPKIYSLDNVDNSLNPRATRTLLEKVINLVCSKEHRDEKIGPQQVFLTSHNPTSLDAFDLFDDDQRVFVVRRRKESGHTYVTRLQPTDNITREKWLEISKGKNLSEMWISNMIPGALGEYEL